MFEGEASPPCPVDVQPVLYSRDGIKYPEAVVIWREMVCISFLKVGRLVGKYINRSHLQNTTQYTTYLHHSGAADMIYARDYESMHKEPSI